MKSRRTRLIVGAHEKTRTPTLPVSNAHSANPHTNLLAPARRCYGPAIRSSPNPSHGYWYPHPPQLGGAPPRPARRCTTISLGGASSESCNRRRNSADKASSSCGTGVYNSRQRSACGAQTEVWNWNQPHRSTLPPRKAAHSVGSRSASPQTCEAYAAAAAQ